MRSDPDSWAMSNKAMFGTPSSLYLARPLDSHERVPTEVARSAVDVVPVEARDVLRQLFPSAAEKNAAPLTFDEVYEAHFDFVVQVLGRQGAHTGDIADLAQEVFLVVHRKLASFEGRSEVRTWLYGIVWRVLKQYRRNRLTRHFEPYDDGILQEDEPSRPETLSADGLLERRRAHQLVLHLIESALSIEQQEVFLLHHFEELSPKEIAAVVQIPLNTVYSRLRVADAGFESAYQRWLKRALSEGGR